MSIKITCESYTPNSLTIRSFVTYPSLWNLHEVHVNYDILKAICEIMYREMLAIMMNSEILKEICETVKQFKR